MANLLTNVTIAGVVCSSCTAHLQCPAHKIQSFDIMKINENSKLQALTEISAIDITLEFDMILGNILKINCKAMSAHQVF